VVSVKVKSYRDLHVWHRSVRFAVEIYRVTRAFPRHEVYGGLTDQIRRAAVSIPSNVAEGQIRHSQRVFANHVDIALGSAAELSTQLLIAREIGYLSPEDHRQLADELTEITNNN
jgi:four helix bundle protein